METTSLEKMMKIEQNDDIPNEKIGGSLPQRQDFSSESNKIEISNLGKFCFAVSIQKIILFQIE